MANDNTVSVRLRDDLVALHASLDAGDERGFWQLIDALAERRKAALAPELRRLTLDAQAALDRFRTEARLDALAEPDMPDSRQPPYHVVKLADQAAHGRLDSVERSGATADRAARESAALSVLWRELAERDQNLFDSSELLTRVQTFLDRTRAEAEQLRTDLCDVLMAQGYRDLTGQIIRSVTRLIAELESVLVQVVGIAGGDAHGAAARLRAELAVTPAAGTSCDSLHVGRRPSVPGLDDARAVGKQDGIDVLRSGIASTAR